MKNNVTNRRDFFKGTFAIAFGAGFTMNLPQGFPLGLVSSSALHENEGGVPKRLTTTATLGRDDVSDRMGPNTIVMAWRDNNTIIFRSRMHEANDFKGQLFAVPRSGGTSEQLPSPPRRFLFVFF